MPPLQFVKAGPASTLASQVRQISLSAAALEGINSFLDALLHATMKEVLSNQASKNKLPSSPQRPYISPELDPDIQIAQETGYTTYPITTQLIKRACLEIWGKNNTLAREGILEAEIVLNEWIRIKGRDSDPAIPSQEARNALNGDGRASTSPSSSTLYLGIPPFRRRPSSRSVSTLQSISDAGEDDDGDGNEAIAAADASEPQPSTHSDISLALHGSEDACPTIEDYLYELQIVLEQISPLGIHAEKFTKHINRPNIASRLLNKHTTLRYTTGLLILYISTFLNHIASTIIHGIADIVEMDPTISEASVGALKEYMMSEDTVRVLWTSLQLSPTASAPLKPNLVPSNANSVRSARLRPRSKSEVPLRQLSTSTTTSSIADQQQGKLKRKRLSIDAELAQAHSNIITLSRASPIEREAAERIRLSEHKRRSLPAVPAVEVEAVRLECGAVETSQVVSPVTPLEKSLRKISGLDPEFVQESPPAVPVPLSARSAFAVMQHARKEGKGRRQKEEEEEEKEKEKEVILKRPRPASSLSFASTGRINNPLQGSFGRTVSMLSRKSSLQRREKGKDKETAEELMRNKRAMQASSIPMRPLSGMGRSSSRLSGGGMTGHRSSSSLGRNVISKSGGAGRKSEDGGRVKVVEQQQPYSSTSTSKLPSPNAPSGGPRRISEEPDFEDLIMRGDTLRMTLTPSRFRQSSKDGSQATPRKVHGSATTLGHAKKHSSSGRTRGYSNSALPVDSSSSSSSTSLSPLGAGIKLKARSAVAPRRAILPEDDTESSNTEKELDMDAEEEDDEEELDLDSEDEAILGPSYRRKRQLLAVDNHRKDTLAKKTKESLFDILNSKPPWEADGTEEPSASSKRTARGNSKAERMVGGGSSASPNTLQQVPRIGPQRFTPIANMDVISTLGTPPESRPVPRSLNSRMADNHDSSSLLATPSIADTRSLMTTISLDGQSDFFSSKASFARTRQEFPLPPQPHEPSGLRYPSETNGNAFASGNKGTSPNRLNSYKSSPNLGTMNGNSMTSLISSDAGASALSVPTMAPPQMRPLPRRMEAKDERKVDKRINDDLIDFLRSATPPPSIAPASVPSGTSLPMRTNTRSATLQNGTSTTKTRLGSVNFRSFMRGGSSKRPSTAPGPASTADFGKFSSASGAGFGGANSGLPAVDEMGRFRSGAGRTTHGSLLNIGRRQSESRDAPLNSLPLQRAVENVVSGSVPPTSFLAHTAHRYNVPSPITATAPIDATTMSTSTMIMTGGHAASPLAKQAHKDWELAQMMEKELMDRKIAQDEEEEQEKEKKKREMMLIQASYATFADAQAQLTPKAYNTSMQAQRDAITHPHPVPAHQATTLQQAPLLTPEHSRDDLYLIATGPYETTLNTNSKDSRAAHGNTQATPTAQAEAISGVDTPPTTPEDKTHASQFKPLQTLQEGEESLPRSSTSSVSASPSTVMPGMAHKHQRRLSAVRRKPSPRVENEIPASNTGNTTTTSQTFLGDTSNHSVLYEFAMQRSRETSNSSKSSGLEPAFATPATKLIDEYRGSNGQSIDAKNKADELQQEAALKSSFAGQASLRSLPATINSTTSSAPLSELTNAPSVTRPAGQPSGASSITGTSRPPSTLLMPLAPRYGAMGNNKSQADIHDVLLSLRNNMISATSVADCLDMIDAALFEVAYDTKDNSTPSVIQEEESTVDVIEPATQKKDTGIEEASVVAVEPVLREQTLATEVEVPQKVVEIIKLRPRTSRYVNRVFDGIVEYYMPQITSRYISTGTGLDKPIAESHIETALAPKKVLSTMVETEDKVPSLRFSSGDRSSIHSDDAASLDKTCSDTTLVGQTTNVTLDGVSKGGVSFIESEEDEQEVLEKAVDLAA